MWGTQNAITIYMKENGLRKILCYNIVNLPILNQKIFSVKKGVRICKVSKIIIIIIIIFYDSHAFFCFTPGLFYSRHLVE